MQASTVGVDVGGTNVRIGLLSPDGTLSAVEKCPRRQALPDDDPGYLGEYIRRYITSRGVPVSAVGIGIPGTLDLQCTSTLKVPNVPCLDGLPFASVLEEGIGLPVRLENDTVMLLTGDIDRLGLDGKGIYAGVYVGTGLGSAVFYNGRPLKGRNGINELGHVPIAGKSEKCTCGNIGCAENYVSGRWLQALRAEKYPDVHISDMFTAMKGSAELEEFIQTFAVVLASIYNFLDPHVVILSGGVVSMKDFPRAELEQAVRRLAMKPQPAQSISLLSSSESDETGVLGAAIFAARNI